MPLQINPDCLNLAKKGLLEHVERLIRHVDALNTAYELIVNDRDHWRELALKAIDKLKNMGVGNDESDK